MYYYYNYSRFKIIISFEKLNNIIIHRFYITLFSALEQAHCAHVACDSEWVAVSFL